MTILFAVGGTGGHVFPAQTLAKTLKVPVIFVGVDLAKNAYFDKTNLYHCISGATLSKQLKIRNLLNVGKILKGFCQSLKIFKKHKIDFVIGFGSFHSFPVLLAAKFLRIPYVLYEPNCCLGLCNRIFQKDAKAIAMQFSTLNIANAHLIRMPIKVCKQDPQSCRKHFGLEENKDTLLIVGGSQGSKAINDWIKKSLDYLTNFQIIHITGKYEDIDKLKTVYRKKNIKSCVKVFEENMEMAYKSSSIAVTRCGATTLAELLANEVPSLLVPYPWAKDGHQLKNAQFMQDVVKGGFLLEEKDFSPQKFLKILTKLNVEQQLLREHIRNYKTQLKRQDFRQLLDKLG